MRPITLFLLLILLLSGCSSYRDLVVSVTKEGAPVPGVRVMCVHVLRDGSRLPESITGEQGKAVVKTIEKGGTTFISVNVNGIVMGHIHFNFNHYQETIMIDLSRGEMALTTNEGVREVISLNVKQ